MTVELPPFKGGLGLTPQSASGIAAFYSATSALVRWLAERSHEWLRYGQCLEDPTTWSAAPLVDLKQTHTRLLRDYQCVEAALAVNAGAGAVAGAGA